MQFAQGQDFRVVQKTRLVAGWRRHLIAGELKHYLGIYLGERGQQPTGQAAKSQQWAELRLERYCALSGDSFKVSPSAGSVAIVGAAVAALSPAACVPSGPGGVSEFFISSADK